MSEGKEGEEKTPVVDEIADELQNTVAYSLIDDAWRLLKINDLEKKYFQQKYRELYEVVHGIKKQEQLVVQEMKRVENETLSERIVLDKTLIEEQEETGTLRKLEEARSNLVKELEYTESRDTMVKFELEELKKVHDELTESFESMKKKNRDTVEPIFIKLKKDNEKLLIDLQNADESFEKETNQKLLLVKRMEELENIRDGKENKIEGKQITLKSAESEPTRLYRQCDAVEKAMKLMEADNKAMKRKFKSFDYEIEQQTKRRHEAEQVKKSLDEKLELNMRTIEKREQDVAIVQSNLDAALAIGHDLLTSRAELNVRKKDVESLLRHKIDNLSFTKKEYQDCKRILKKKSAFVLGMKGMIPTLEEQLRGSELQLKTLISEKNIKSKDVLKMKDEVDSFIADFLLQEGLEGDKKRLLEDAIMQVDDAESAVVHALSETKKQSKMLSVLSGQRDIKARDFARVDTKEKEARSAVKVKELNILDLTKRCTEISNRLKEFTALYDVVKNERNKYVSLLQGSTQATAEIKEKIRILNNEVEVLGNESLSKDTALIKEKSAHSQAQNHRNTLRQDMNRLLSEYRSKQGNVEQQIMEIDKLNVVINNLEKDMLDLKSKFENSVEERNITGVQLIDRNDELCILYERSNQQTDALKKGELELMKKDWEFRQLRLQIEELKRQYIAAKHKLPEREIHSKNIIELENKLSIERKKIDDLSSRLEDPANGDRWRALEGDDPSTEQLLAKISILEDRLDQKREVLLEKELVLEEITNLTERLKKQAMNKRDGAKVLATELNGLQGKIRDTTKLMLATVSELSMYQATALRLQQEKTTREKILEEARWKLDHGEAPTDDAVKTWNRNERKRLANIETAIRREEELQEDSDGKLGVKSAAVPRPTAYIPDDMGIPKPYGASAPFKPTEAGATMRHIKMVNPKAIEI